MLQKKSKAVIYVHTHHDAFQFADEPGVEEQTGRAMKLAEAGNMEVADVYVDDGFDTIALQRPGFLNMLLDIMTGDVDTIVVDDIARISSNPLELAYILTDILPEVGADLAFRDISIETDSEDDKAGELMRIIRAYAGSETEDDETAMNRIVMSGKD